MRPIRSRINLCLGQFGLFIFLRGTRVYLQFRYLLAGELRENCVVVQRGASLHHRVLPLLEHVRLHRFTQPFDVFSDVFEVVDRRQDDRHRLPDHFRVDVVGTVQHLSDNVGHLFRRVHSLSVERHDEAAFFVQVDYPSLVLQVAAMRGG